MQTYLVGGAVRDSLLGLAIYDRDWVVIGATADDLLKQGFRQVGADFPCFLHPDTKEEYALGRTERKQGQGYKGFVCDFGPEVTLEEDLLRRDLTINAMAQSETGAIIDPYGGQQDLHDKVLRHVSPAFVEDPLRVLRVARFAARFQHLGFRVHEDTLALMANLAISGELATLTAERVWKELSRALTEPTPSAFFETLRVCGALHVLLPEVDVLYGVPQRAEYHPEVDTGIHTMLCVDYAAKTYQDPEITWASLMHDLGKGITPKEEWPRHLQHERRGVPLVKAVGKRLRVPKAYQSLALLVCEQHLNCHRATELRPATVLKLFQKLDVFRKPDQLVKFTQACCADARGRTGFETVEYPQAHYLQQCFEAAKSIDIATLVAEGHKGKVLADKIAQQRIIAIGAVKSVLQQQQQ